MADYNSIYSGQEIDEAVGKALNPDSAPTAGSQALVTSGGVKSALNQKADNADLGALEQTVQTQGGKISTIEGKIPTAASPSNQLADKGFVTNGLGTKQDTIQDLEQIRTRANEGHTAYQKPSGGIPKADLDSGVQTSLGKADTAVQPARVEAIEEKIPAQASSENKLADKNFVNSTVATATATFRGTYNLVSDLGLTVTATQQQIAAAIVTKLAALGITADNNDYVFVQIPTANDKPTEIARVDRYKYNGSAWGYEWSLNNSSFTAAQWAALNSGITSELVTKLGALPTAAALSELFNGKVDKVEGKGLSTNDYSDDEKTKLGALPTNAELTTALSGKADKDADAVKDNLAKFDANGNPIDSGIPADEIGDLSLRVNALELNAIDLSMRDNNGNRTYVRNTANSYAVHEAGEYCIPLVYGNGIKKDKQNTAAWTRKGTTYTADFVNHLGNTITNAYIEKNSGCTPYSAALLWQTTSGVVSSVKLVKGEDCMYLQFTVASVPTTNADVLLAVKDENGDVMWSWMIWVVADSFNSFKLKNHTNVEYEMLSLPLGAIWNSNKTRFVVPYFQWGRKDPMCPPSAYNSTTNMTLYDISGNTVSAQGYGVADDADAGGTVRSVANAIKMPDKFFLEYDASKYNWNNLAWFNNFWNANETTSGSLADDQATAIKTIYDPCLPGWTLPSGRFATGFTTTGDNTSTASQFNVVGTWDSGWKFKRDSEDADGVFFPASGLRNRTSGALYNVGSYGYWWPFAPYSQTLARFLYFYSGYVYPLLHGGRANGCGVWPCRELN